MNQKTEELLKMTFNFGVDTLRYLMNLPKDKVYSIIIFQLGKALLHPVLTMKKRKVLNNQKILIIKLESY